MGEAGERFQVNAAFLGRVFVGGGSLAQQVGGRISEAATPGLDSDDLLQETCLVILTEALPLQMPNREDARRVFAAIARNVQRNLLRKLRGMKGGGASEFIHDESILEQVPSSELDPSCFLAMKEGVLAIESAIHALPERLRTVFVAHCLKGEALASVASRLGITCAAAKTRAWRARQVLALFLATTYPESVARAFRPPGHSEPLPN